MIQIVQPTQNTVKQNQEYISTVEEINEVPLVYRKLVDELYYEFCMHPSKEEAHDGLQKVVQILQELKDKSDF